MTPADAARPRPDRIAVTPAIGPLPAIVVLLTSADAARPAPDRIAVIAAISPRSSFRSPAS